MKYIVMSEKNTVAEIIPEFDPAFPEIPIQERYASDFLAHCVKVEDDVEVGNNWIYEDGAFRKPSEQEAEIIGQGSQEGEEEGHNHSPYMTDTNKQE